MLDGDPRKIANRTRIFAAALPVASKTWISQKLQLRDATGRAAARKINEEGRAIPTDTENDLTIEVQASALPTIIKNQIPESANSIRLTSHLKKDNFFTKAVITFNKEFPNKIDNWEIPTRTITEPQVSFTAARGIGLSTAQEVLNPLQLKPTNNQFFAWSQGRTKFQSFFSVKVDDPKSEISNLSKSPLMVFSFK